MAIQSIHSIQAIHTPQSCIGCIEVPVSSDFSHLTKKCIGTTIHYIERVVKIKREKERTKERERKRGSAHEGLPTCGREEGKMDSETRLRELQEGKGYDTMLEFKRIRPMLEKRYKLTDEWDSMCFCISECLPGFEPDFEAEAKARKAILTLRRLHNLNKCS